MTINRSFVRFALVSLDTKKMFHRFLDTWDSMIEAISASLTGLTATAAELNMAADNSANTEILTATKNLTAAESGKTLILTGADGYIVALPPKAAGLRFKFIVGVETTASTDFTISADAGDANTLEGGIVSTQVTTPANLDVNAASNVLVLTYTTPAPLFGTEIEFFSDGVKWYVQGRMRVNASLALS